MKMSGRVIKAEAVIYPERASAVPCAWHALADLFPRVPVDPADIFAGSCGECGGDMDFNMERCTPRERELSAEFYPRGWTCASLTASRRSLAAMLWLNRRGTKIMARPDEVYKRALIEEHDRRMIEKWAAHWETVSNEALEEAAELLEREPPDAELEAIIWPEGFTHEHQKQTRPSRGRRVPAARAV